MIIYGISYICFIDLIKLSKKKKQFLCAIFNAKSIYGVCILYTHGTYLWLKVDTQNIPKLGAHSCYTAQEMRI